MPSTIPQFPPKLHPYILLSKSTKGTACVQLIKDATATPGLFVFGELLDVPNVLNVHIHLITIARKQRRNKAIPRIAANLCIWYMD